MSPGMISPVTYTLRFQKWKPLPQKNQRRLYENIKAGILAFFFQILLLLATIGKDRIEINAIS